MTPQEYKNLAAANGYKLEAKTDTEFLADYAFHKAACVGMEEEVFSSVKDKLRGQALATFHFPHRIRFMVALDGLDSGRPEADIWLDVCAGRTKKSECHDINGSLILSKL